MKHWDTAEIPAYLFAVVASVLLGAAIPLLSDRGPSVDASPSTALSESTGRGDRKKTVSSDESKSGQAAGNETSDESKSGQAAGSETEHAGGDPQLPTSKTEAAPLGQLKGAADFDPPPGDGEEHSEQVAFAVDGDSATTWSTERYSGGLAAVGKDGVGLAVDAGSAVKAGELELETKTPGWSGEVYAANQQADAIAGWGKPVSPISNASEEETVPLEASEPARYYLVWITDLGNGHTVELSELQLLGS